MSNPFRIFCIKHEERWLAIVGLLLLVVLHGFVIAAYGDDISVMRGDCKDQLFQLVSLSGFDVYSLAELTQWAPMQEIVRHPLIAYMLYPAYLINQGLISVFGVNCALYVMAFIIIFCAIYSLIFLYRILREIVGIGRVEATILSFMHFSFAYVMLASIAPDHFMMSLFILLLTLYVAGKKMQKGRKFTIWQTVLFFIITAGISLSNGVKVFLANLFTNGRRFFAWRNIVFAVLLPTVILWGIAQIEWNHYKKPEVEAAKRLKEKQDRIWRDSIFTACWNQSAVKDSDVVRKQARKIINIKVHEKFEHDHQQAAVMHSGKPVSKKKYLAWTDITTDRWRTAVDNLMGETIQLHRDHLLEDTLVSRPLFVSYRNAFNYVIEALLALLFIMGIWHARRSRFYWLCFSFFAFDMLLHFVLGFGINEIYIMGPHFLFIIPVSIAFTYKHLKERRLKMALSVICGFLTLWLLIWNGSLIAAHLMGISV